MGFMSNPAGGDSSFTVYVKYNAKAGRWYTKEDKPEAVEYEVTNMTAVFDIPNIKTGWFLFAAGVAPSKTYDPSLSQASAKPGEGFKRGFELHVFSEKNLGGVREFSSTAGAVIESMNAVYDSYVAAPESKEGKLPVVKCVGVHADHRQARHELSAAARDRRLGDRPAELGDATASAAPAAAPPQRLRLPSMSLRRPLRHPLPQWRAAMTLNSDPTAGASAPAYSGFER
jgi:hypothetical protein